MWCHFMLSTLFLNVGDGVQRVSHGTLCLELHLSAILRPEKRKILRIVTTRSQEPYRHVFRHWLQALTNWVPRDPIF